MKILVSLIILCSVILSGCSYESLKEREEIERDNCKGLYIRGKCYKNVVEYCDNRSSRSERDNERNEQQRKEYEQCININKNLFPDQ